MTRVFECRKCGRPPSSCRCAAVLTRRHLTEAAAALCTWAFAAAVGAVMLAGSK